MLLVKESILNLNEKNDTTLSNCPQVRKIYSDRPVKILFLMIWVFDYYMIELSCLYMPHGHYFVLCGYEVQMNIILFLAKVHL